MAGTLLVLGEEEFEVLGVVDSIENRENGTTGVTDWKLSVRTKHRYAADHGVLTDVLHALAKHHLVEDLSTTHSDHSSRPSISFRDSNSRGRRPTSHQARGAVCVAREKFHCDEVLG